VRDRDRMVKIVVWVMIIALVLTVVASIAPLIT
jgi:hypothetical protein